MSPASTYTFEYRVSTPSGARWQVRLCELLDEAEARSLLLLRDRDSAVHSLTPKP